MVGNFHKGLLFVLAVNVYQKSRKSKKIGPCNRSSANPGRRLSCIAHDTAYDNITVVTFYAALLKPDKGFFSFRKKSPTNFGFMATSTYLFHTGFSAQKKRKASYKN